MSIAAGPCVAQTNLLLDIDIASEKVYPGSGATVTDVVSGYVFTANNPTYYTFSNGTVQFTRSASAPKDGGGMRVAGVAGSLAANTFLYNDFSWEVWVRIDDRQPGNYDGTEGVSAIALYDGYHSGWTYGPTTVDFVLWNTGPAGVYVQQYTLGGAGSGLNVIEGTWNQLVITKSGTSYTKYKNGSIVGSANTANITIPSPFIVNSNINIGKAANVGAGVGSYLCYSKNTFAAMRMYNRALSTSEIAGNFAATRGRFGI